MRAKFFVVLVAFALVIFTLLLVVGFHKEPKGRNVNNSFDMTSLSSNLESNEYVCFGNCYCLDSNERRMSTTSIPLLKRGLTYAVATVSSVVAYNMAEKYFEGECEQRLGDSCSLGIVKSEIDSCEQNTENEAESVDPKEDVGVKVKRSFKCVGTCLKIAVPDFWIKEGFETEENQKLVEDMTQRLEAENWKCEEISTEKDMKVEMPTDDWITKHGAGAKALVTGSQVIERLFIEKVLDPMCVKNSLTSLTHPEDKKKEQKSIPFCTGVRFDNQKRPYNPTVLCTEFFIQSPEDEDRHIKKTMEENLKSLNS